MDSGTGTSLALSLLLSAVVAAVVTLIIEYAAKPSLEARKERILREKRLLWELKVALFVFQSKCGTMVDWLEQDRVELSALEKALDRLFEDLDRIETASIQTAEVIGVLPVEIYGELSYAIGRHEAMRERYSEIQRLIPDQRLPHYREDLTYLGVDLHIPIAYLSARRESRRRKLRAEAAQRNKERGFDEDD